MSVEHLHVVQMSGGLSSAETAVRVAAKAPPGTLRLLFCDTLVEDNDLYRFLVEASAYVLGVPLDANVKHLAALGLLLPPVSEATLPARKTALAELRSAAMSCLPGLVWLAEGRTPWEVVFQTRFLSHRADKCSEFLKRRLADAWCSSNCDPEATTRYVGFGHNEQDRIMRSAARFSKAGWRVAFPMDGAPLVNRVDLMAAWREREIDPPRLYFKGYSHNNCGGFCFKGGQASAARLLATNPSYYGFNERMEEQFRETVRIDASTLKDRQGGGPRRPISLRQFRESVESGCGYDYSDRGACSCFAEVDETPEASHVG